MSTPRQPLDAWLEDARSLLREDEDVPESSWPTPEKLSTGLRVTARMLGVAVHVMLVVAGCGAALFGRTDPLLTPMVTFALVATLGPYFILERPASRAAVSVAAGMRGDAVAQRSNAKTWRISAWILGLVAIVALVATGITYGRYAGSSTPFLRAAPIRWSLLAASLLGLAALAVARFRSARRSSEQTAALIEELELDDPAATKSWSDRDRARLLLGLFGLSFAGGSSYVLTPDNEPDSPARVLVVGPNAAEHAPWLHEHFGLEARGLSMDEAWATARQRFGGDTGQLETLTRYADLEGIGFVFIDLRAFPVEFSEREDVRLASPNAKESSFAVLATGDVNVLSHAYSWGGQPRSRARWVPLGPHSTTLAVADPRVEGKAADRIALARALFAQPAFLHPDTDNPENPPELNGRSQTLMRGMIYFGLPADFWHDAVASYTDMEAVLAKGRVPAELEE